MAKICYITTIPSTMKAFILETAKYMHYQGGHDIYFICDVDSKFELELPSYIKYIQVPMKRGISIRGINAMMKMYKIFKKEKFDIVQYCTPNASLYASVAARVAFIPIRLYCQWGIVYVSFNGIKRGLFKFIEKIVCISSTHIQPDSHGNLKFSIAEKLYTERKASVIWNGSASGVDLDKFSLVHKKQWDMSTRRQLEISEDTFVVGFVGRINSDKGINELLHVMRRLIKKNYNIMLLIVGTIDKPETLNKELYKWSLDNKNIIYNDFSNEIEKYFSAMDVYVLPSYREGFGTSVIEAQAMGVPVIITDIPGPTDAIIDGVTGLITEKGDTKSLYNALLSLVKYPKKGEMMGQRGHEFVKENFDSHKIKEYILKDREKILLAEKSKKGNPI